MSSPVTPNLDVPEKPKVTPVVVVKGGDGPSWKMLSIVLGILAVLAIVIALAGK